MTLLAIALPELETYQWVLIAAAAALLWKAPNSIAGILESLGSKRKEDPGDYADVKLEDLLVATSKALYEVGEDAVADCNMECLERMALLEVAALKAGIQKENKAEEEVDVEENE